jgi:hypothetical protein
MKILTILALAVPLAAQTPVTIPPAQATADAVELFNAVLNRVPNPAGLQTQINNVAAGTLTPSQYVERLLNSAEFQGSVSEQAAFVARLVSTVPPYVPVIVTTNYCVAAPTGLPPLPSTVVIPALPQTCAVPVMPTPAKLVIVNTSAALTAALASLSCGTEIWIQAGVVYSGAGFTVPGVTCASNPVLIAGSGLSSIPVGQTIQQSLAGSSGVPTIECNTPGCSPWFISDGASGIYHAGLEFTLDPVVGGTYPIVAMGENTTTVAALPSNITFDRVLVHPAPCLADSMTAPCNRVIRGIDLNAVNGTVMYSNIWGIVNAGNDTQGINVMNSPGPGLILGNFIEATGENLMFNTSCTSYTPGPAGPNGQPMGSTGWVTGDAGIPTCPAPSDYTVRLNHFHKSPAWQTLPAGCIPSAEDQCYDVKNDTEVKHGQRILFDSNFYDYTFPGGQAEFIIANCWAGGAYRCRDLTYTNNKLLNGPEVFAFAGNGLPEVNPLVCGTGTLPACQIQTGINILFQNNLATGITGAFGQVQWSNGIGLTYNTSINGSTAVNDIGLSFSDGQPSTDFQFSYIGNIIGQEPFNDAGCPGCALSALPTPTIGKNVFVNGYWTPYTNIFGAIPAPAFPAGVVALSSPEQSNLLANTTPPTTCQQPNAVLSQAMVPPGAPVDTVVCWPLAWPLVGMVDWVGCNAGTDLPGCALASTSAYVGLGANVAAVLAATAGIQ